MVVIQRSKILKENVILGVFKFLSNLSVNSGDMRQCLEVFSLNTKWCIF